MGKVEEAVVDLIWKKFDGLPATRKPRDRGDAHEWVPLSGIVLSKGR